jgi:phenylalanyl-tRNA synthetase alpha chain
MNDYYSDFENLNSVSKCLELKEKLLNDHLSNLKEQISKANIEDKKKLGKELNNIRTIITKAASKRIQEIQEIQEIDNFVEFDETFVSDKFNNSKGSLHPLTIIISEIVNIFRNLNYDVSESKDVQSQYNNFTGVNSPDYHPARDMQDTFFLDKKDELGENYVLSTQVTSNIIPYALTHKPPFRVIFPGIVYRNENIDATHDINFTQFDMWMVDKKASLSELISIIEHFFREFFEDKTLTVRLRPSYFPFTQPSFEGDVMCPFCSGKGCRICKQTGWIEVFGAGPVHVNVIKNMGLNPDEWEGLAFGFGVDRLAQLKFRIMGISQFYNGNLDFLRGK